MTVIENMATLAGSHQVIVPLYLTPSADDIVMTTGWGNSGASEIRIPPFAGKNANFAVYRF